jgi:hypothetical protein
MRKTGRINRRNGSIQKLPHSMYFKKNGTPDHSPMKMSPAMLKQDLKGPLNFEKFNVDPTSTIEEEKINRPKDLRDVFGNIDPRIKYQNTRSDSPVIEEVLSDR